MQPTVRAWMRAMDRVGLAVLRALALGLGQPLHHFDDVVLPRGDPHLKIIRYPAQQRDADTGQGVGMHHDSGLVSFVLQDDVGGLQVEQDGALLDATPLQSPAASAAIPIMAVTHTVAMSTIEALASSLIEPCRSRPSPAGSSTNMNGTRNAGIVYFHDCRVVL